MILPGLVCACGSDDVIALRPGFSAVAAIVGMDGETIRPALPEEPPVAWCRACWPYQFRVVTYGG